MNNIQKCIRKEIDHKLINEAQVLIKEEKTLLKRKSEIFSLVGNEIRLSIVYLLISYEKLCVCDISDILDISQSVTSQHLRKLKDGKLIDNIRDGATIFYFIKNDIKCFFENNIKE